MGDDASTNFCRLSGTYFFCGLEEAQVQIFMVHNLVFPPSASRSVGRPMKIQGGFFFDVKEANKVIALNFDGGREFSLCMLYPSSLSFTMSFGLSNSGMSKQGGKFLTFNAH